MLTQDAAALQGDETKVAQDERALASARRLARPQNAATLSGAEATVASDVTGLRAARAQLITDDGLACPPASSSDTTTALSGGSADNNNASASGGSPTGGHAADAHTADATGGSGPTAGAPNAQTGAVDGTSNTGTTLTGSVTPNGLDTTYYFEYGTSSAYGSATATQDAGSGSNPVGVSMALSGLTPGTSYEFRLVAVNSQGPSYGQPSMFATTAGPQASTGSATPTSTGATFSGTVAPGGLNTSYYFEYGTTSSFGSKTPVQSTDSDAGSVPNARQPSAA